MARSRDRMTALAHRPGLLVLLGWAFAAPLSWADEPPQAADARAGWRQLGKLRAGLAFTAREEQRESIKAGHLYLQAAPGLHRPGDDESRKALVAGIVATQPLRATWPHPEPFLAAAFGPGDRQVLTCAGDG